MQSIEHTLRDVNRAAADQQQQLQRLETTRTDYQAQAQRPFEHEARLKELLTSSTRPSTSTKATPRPRRRRSKLTLKLRRYLAVPSQLRQECSQTPCQPRTPDPTTRIRFCAFSLIGSQRYVSSDMYMLTHAVV